MLLAAVIQLRLWRRCGRGRRGPRSRARERFDHPLWTGTIVLLFSPQFGLVEFFPAMLLAPIALYPDQVLARKAPTRRTDHPVTSERRIRGVCG